MCRHLGWLGEPVSVASLMLEPPSGLLVQSYAPRRQKHGLMNADGWGVGFFDRSVPRRWRSASPLWGDPSFASVAPALSSGCVVAAVRSASVNMPVEASASAPFTDGTWLLSHNGIVDRAVLPMSRRAESTNDSALLAALIFDRGLDHLGDTIVEVAADLTDFNVNQNAWIPSMLASKMGLFGMDWKYTPFFDNKAAFQLGINEILRRTSFELVDRLGRVRGTSQIDQNLQDARQNLNYKEDLWYVTTQAPYFIAPTPATYRTAVRNLRAFNQRLASCDTTFDPRADNLLRFLDTMTNAIGSTSDILRDQIEVSDAGWFDTRADDRFWFAYGQLYALNGIMAAAQSDFQSIVNERGLSRTWEEADQQLRSALDMRPWIISNGAESAFIMPSHLATMGFYLLRVRANMTEMRDILDR